MYRNQGDLGLKMTYKSMILNINVTTSGLIHAYFLGQWSSYEVGNTGYTTKYTNFFHQSKGM